jgi:ferredoxin-NADP reductase
MQEFLTEVVQKKYLTLDIVELVVRLVAPEEIKFQAGQYMQFKVNTAWQRYFIANPPGQDVHDLTFCVKLEPVSIGSDYVRSLELGTEVVMRGPDGTFTIENYNEPVFFVANGVGIAPYASMVPDMLVRGYSEKFALLFGLRSEENVFYYDRFRRLSEQHPNFKFVPTLSRPVSHWPGEIGHVTTYLKVNYEFYKDHLFYLCGSKEVVTDAQKTLLENGHSPKRIKIEMLA